MDSEAPPDGQTSIVGAPPLLLRGSLDTTNLTYGYTNLRVGAPRTWTLAGKGLPGSETEVVLGLNRSAISATPGELLAGILRLTDSLGHSQVDLPVSATAASTAGLWVGVAMVTQVGQYLKSYERNASDQPVVDTNGQYVVTTVNTNLGVVPRFFPLRLIVHNPTNNGGAILLQRVFVGLNAFTNPVVATRESVLGGAFLGEARRISATHLPWSEANAGWAFTGKLGLAATVTATVTNDFNDHASNPFVHTYHPDHDNRNATFQNVLPQGAESYTVVRDITLQVTPPTDDFTSLTAVSQTLGGAYVETIRLLGLAREGGAYDARQFEVRGAFSLNRINDVPILTTTP